MGNLQSPIGVDNFYKLMDLSNNYLFVDKSLFIKEIIEDKSEVTLITRPRRWGKTLNLSMLHHFLSPQVYRRSTQGLFNHLKIAKEYPELCSEHQGKYPAIFITFAGTREIDFNIFLSSVRELIRELYNGFYPILISSDLLTPGEKSRIEQICAGITDQGVLEHSLTELSSYLYRIYSQPVYILIDEYDTPLHEAFNNDQNDNYQKTLNFMRNLMLFTLKSNPYLKKGILTGILRLAKETMFSSLSHLDVYTVLSPEYKQHFGFDTEEVTQLFKKANLTVSTDEIRKYYNGYQIDGQIIYNPWSIMKCIKENGRLGTYWVNTGNDAMLNRMMINAPISVKEQFERLLRGETIHVVVSDYIRFQDVDGNDIALWSLLLAAGYLTPRHTEFYETEYRCELDIPNREVRSLYHMVFIRWLDDRIGDNRFQTFLQDLVQGRLQSFAEKLNQYLLRHTSYHDFPQESNYHTFMLGLLGAITDQYQLHSNIRIRQRTIGYPIDSQER